MDQSNVFFQAVRLVHWQSKIDLENFENSGYAQTETDEYQEVCVPHSWQDYQGYQGLIHGDLHGSAYYRCRVPSSSKAIQADSRIRLYFEGVSGRCCVSVNKIPVGEHTGAMVGFTLDVTEAWREGSENRIEVKASTPSKDETQPFYCGGCAGAPASEGSQPFGIFRPVHLLISGPAHIEPFGIYLWLTGYEPEVAQLRMRYELRNPGSEIRTGCLTTRILDPEGRVALDCSQEVDLSEAGLLREEVDLQPLENPHYWSPDVPANYSVCTRLLSPDGELWDEQVTPLALRKFRWPKIALPDTDHDVRSSVRRGKVIDDGLAPADEVNHFHNERTRKPEDHRAEITLGSVHVQGAVSEESADLSISAEVEFADFPVLLKGEITNDLGTVFQHQFQAAPNEMPHRTHLKNPRLWTESAPYLYRLTLDLLCAETNTRLDRIIVRFACIPNRDCLNVGQPIIEESEDEKHPVDQIEDSDKVFRVNGQPVFQKGGCAYETLLGNDYAWEDDQVSAFCETFARAGFNAFRDGHHPHNLMTYQEWDQRGILCWTQMGSHLYFESETFKENLKQAVRAWVRERRNHPCVFAWGIQNESVIPEDFARELCEIVKEEDPTTGLDRLTTTCNGGKGSDWNVPQEWSGTYGGNCHDFDLERAQLVGEYGSWRLIGEHADKDYEGDENDFTESWASYSLGVKIRKGLEVRDRAMGAFHWVFQSFPNPGRSPDKVEGRDNGAIGPINGKGLFSAWLQPTDAYYLYQSSYTTLEMNPMVYIVSHTWPDRWDEPGMKDRILVYSNCESVELYNDVGDRSLGRRSNPGVGRPFRWDQADIRNGLLYAEGLVGEKVVARDIIRLPALPEAPGLVKWIAPPATDPTELPAHCIRLNCGGSRYIDGAGHAWEADEGFLEAPRVRSRSWSSDFAPNTDELASVGKHADPVRGTKEQTLYQSFRYGRHRLHFRFGAGKGRYRIHIGLLEPWFGIGNQHNTCTGWRKFDIAVNDQTLAADIDPWKRVGTLTADRLTIEYQNTGEYLNVHFPRVAAAQALVAWIALEPMNG